MIAKMRAGNPYLSEVALGLIGGYFSFRWRCVSPRLARNDRHYHRPESCRIS